MDDEGELIYMRFWQLAQELVMEIIVYYCVKGFTENVGNKYSQILNSKEWIEVRGNDTITLKKLPKKKTKTPDNFEF